MRAVLFDLDGTLVDSLADIGGSLNHVLAELGMPTHSLATYRALVGDGASKLVWDGLPEDRRDELHALALDRYKERYRTHLVVDSRPFAGIDEMLARVQGAGFALGVVTNKPHDAGEAVVAHLFPRYPWGAIAGQRDGHPHKPDPSGALEVASKLGVAPEQCFFVGDTGTDMKTAVNAGMVAIGCTWGFRDRDELIATGAKHLADTPADVARIVLGGV